MIYEEVVKKAIQTAKKIDTEKVEEHIAAEFDIEGEGEGAFYVELDKGKITVQPFEYYDYDCRIRGTADVITDLIAGNIDATAAYLEGRFRVEGSFDKAVSFARAVATKNATKSGTTKRAAGKASRKTVKTSK